MMRKKLELAAGYLRNKLGFPYKAKELYDPVPLKSKVAFRRPLSASERVARAIKQHEHLRRLQALPGDQGFDEPELDTASPHQLMTDPISGQEMTSGEYVMLQNERQEARQDVQKLRAFKEEQKFLKKQRRGKKFEKTDFEEESLDSDTDDESD